MTDSDAMAGMTPFNKNVSLNGMKRKDVSEILISDLKSGMFVIINIYSKCIGLVKELDPTTASVEDIIAQDMPLLLLFTLKYGTQEIQWIERDCQEMHKAKEVELEYLLG